LLCNAQAYLILVPIIDLRGLGIPNVKLLGNMDHIPRYAAPEVPPNTPVLVCHTASRYIGNGSSPYLNLNVVWVGVLADAPPMFASDARRAAANTGDEMDMGF
jgi:hypothetical protein